MTDDFNKTQQDLKPPRLSWYEQRRPSVGDDKSTTITISWAKVGPAIGLVVFIGGLVTTSVNAAVSVAQYKAQIEATERKVEEQQAQLRQLQEQVTILRANQELVERLQSRLAALENAPMLDREERGMARINRDMSPRLQAPRESSAAAAGLPHE